LAEVYFWFLQLYKKFSTHERKNELMPKIKDRWEFIRHEIMGVSYLLTPKYLLRYEFLPYESDDLENIIQAVKKLGLKRNCDVKKLIEELMSYIEHIRNCLEDTRDLIEMIDGRNYWINIGSRKFPTLALVGIEACSKFASSAASERAWSTFDFIHSKNRNRLSNMKLNKMVYLYANISLLDEVDKNNYYNNE
jgi:hypothetical protein